MAWHMLLLQREHGLAFSRAHSNPERGPGWPRVSGPARDAKPPSSPPLIIGSRTLYSLAEREIAAGGLQAGIKAHPALSLIA
jgi:hypothetical protein